MRFLTKHKYDFEGNHVQSQVVSEQLEIEKDDISKKKRKRDSSQSSLQDPTYDQLMTTVTKLEGTVATLTETGDARVSTLTQTMSSLQGTINTLESRLLALEKSLPLANRRKLRVKRTPLKLKSLMRCYSRKMRCTIPPPASATILVPMTTTKLLNDTIHTHLDDSDAAKDTHLDAATTISVPMMTTEKLKDTIHIDDSDAAAKEIRHTEDELQFLGMEKGDKPKYDLPNLRITCETSFWDILYSGGEKAEYLEQGKLDGLSFVYGTLDCGVMTCKFIEMLTKGKTIDIKSYGDNVGLKCQKYRAKMELMLYETRLSELVAFHIDSRKLMSMVLVVDALRATIDGTNPMYPSWHKISQVFFPINLENKH
nr:hypothetical protein [Tanacetum cinerariifolium]